MSTTVNWPSLNPTTFSVPAAGEVNWPSLSNFLVSLGTSAQSTAAQKIAIRVALSTPVTVVQTTDCVIVSDLTTPGAVAVQLPAGVGGQVFMIADGKGDAATNNITISAFSGETINGSPTLVLNKARSAVILVFNATTLRWTAVAEFTNIAAGTIPRSSVAAGTANYVIINDGTGKLSEEQYLAKVRGGTGADNSAVTFPSTGTVVTEAATETLTNKSVDGATNTLTNVDLPSLKTVLADANKVIRRDAAGVIVSGNTVPNTNPLLTTDSTQTLTNKSIDGGTNPLTNIDLPSLKTVLADANKVLRRDAAGLVIDGNLLPNASDILTTDGVQVVTLKDLDGGTASNTSRVTLPKDTFANIGVLTRKKGTLLYATDLDTVFYDDGTNLLPVGSGSGAGELNVVSNPDAATSITGVTLTGTATVTRQATGGPLSPIVATAFRFAGGAATDKELINFTLPSTLLNKKLKCEFYFAVETGYVDGDWKLQIWNQAGTVQYPLSTDVSNVSGIPNTTGKFTTYFDTQNETTLQVRFVRVLGTKYIDVTRIIVGPGIQPQGAVVTDTKSFTPTFSNSTNVLPQFSQYVRIGNKMHLHMRFDFVAAGVGGLFTVAIPSSLTIDASTFPGGVTEYGYGDVSGGAGTFSTAVRSFSSTQLYFIRTTATSFSYAGTDFVTGNVVNFQAIISIAEWAGSGVVNLAQNDVEYVSNSSATNANDLTSFVTGSYGSQFPNASGGTRTKRVQFQNTQPSDEIVIEVTNNFGAGWFTAGTIPTVYPLFAAGAFVTGMYIDTVPGVANQLDIGFGHYRDDTNNTFAAISGTDQYRWRVKKEKAGVAVGFGLVTGTAAGLTKATSTFGRLRLNTEIGYGSTNTTIKRWSVTVENTGTDISYVDSSTLGSSFTVLTSGLYAMSYCSATATGGNWGLSRNSGQLSTNIAIITAADRIALASNAAGSAFSSDVFGNATCTYYFIAGDVIRTHGDGSGTTGTPDRTAFTIIRIA